MSKNREGDWGGVIHLGILDPSRFDPKQGQAQAQGRYRLGSPRQEVLSEERKGEDTVKHLRQRSGSAANAAALPLDSDQAKHSKRLRQAKPGCDLFGRPLC